jgi:hypothetical protein
MRIRHALPAAGIVLLLVALASGCGRRDMGRVSGTLTFQGKPVPKATVKFTPLNRPAGAGETDAAGRFAVNTLKPGDGAFQGACVVTVIPGAEFEEGSIAPKPRPDIPEKYRDSSTTPFKADVVAGKENVFRFDME